MLLIHELPGVGVGHNAATDKKEKGEPSVVVHASKHKLQRPIKMTPKPRSAWTTEQIPKNI